MNFDTIGEMVLGSRLRALSEKVTADAADIYALYDIALKPKWFPVFYFLSTQNTGSSITSIAKAIGHSHPSVISIVREMAKRDLVLEQKDELDGRKNNIALTKKGIEITLKIKKQYTDVENAIKKTLQQTNHNIWLAMQEFEYLLNDKSLISRVQEEKKARESASIKISEFLPKHKTAFQQLNEEWITTYFKLEDTDRKALDDPKGYILDKGGAILVATQDTTVVGVCALLKMHDSKYNYELAKMAVSPKAQGKGVGYLLGKATINKAISLNANYLYLESNTILKPAIALYDKLGFKKIAGRTTPYERCNIQMELKLN